MSDPVQYFGYRMRQGPRGYRGAVYHDHGQRQLTGRRDFCIGTTASGILGHDQIDAVLLHQRQITLNDERATIQHSFAVRKRQRCIRCVNQPKQIKVLWIRRELGQMHAAYSQHDTASRPVQSGDGSSDVRDICPIIAIINAPRGTRQRDQRHARLRASSYGIAAHLCGKGMCRVDNMGDGMSLQICCQTRNAAKAAYALGQWLANGPRHTTGERDRGADARLTQDAAQRGAFGRAAQHQKVWLHV